VGETAAGHNGRVRSLRVMSYNVRGLKDDRAVLVEVLRAAEPDVVALQEPPRGPLGGPRLRRLAQDAGLEVAVSGGGARTTALLVRPGRTVTHPATMRLPSAFLRTRRGIALAEVDGLLVVSVHLGLSARERSRQLVRLVPVVAAAPAVVLAGDLNEGPGGPVWRRLALHLRDLAPSSGPTYPAREPRARIDAVLGSRGLTATRARTLADDPASRASDHLPVVVDVSWA
jgi:endonuclease/exonuclease/phosphatase family metal-dependent hydrolase